TGGGKLKRARDVLTWTFTKEQSKVILARMERLKTLVQIALENDHLFVLTFLDTSFILIHPSKLTREIEKQTRVTASHTSTIRQQDLPRMESKLDRLSQAHHTQEWERHIQLMEWLSPLDFAAQHSDMIRRRQEGTGEWFLKSTQFSKWFQGPRETLFCPGI